MRAICIFIAGAALVACTRRESTQTAQPQLRLEDLRAGLASETTLGAGTGEVVRRPWIGPFVEVLTVDGPSDLELVRQPRVAALGMDPDRLIELALANLQRVCPQPIQGERTVKMAKAQVQITRFADNHTAARLLLPALWAPIAASAGGHLFAAAPARDIVVWTTSMDENDQRALRGQARTAFQSRSYPISPAILRWTGRSWVVEDANPVPAAAP